MRWLRSLMLAAVLTLAAGDPLMAKIPDNPGPPATPSRRLIYGSYIAIGVLMAAVLTAVFKPSKRTHQD